MSLKSLLKNVIPEPYLSMVPSSFEIIGSRSGAIAIIEIPDELDAYKHEIAEAIKRMNKNITTVLRRRGPRSGPYRLYNYEVLIEGPTEVLHKEHGYYIKVDPTKVYFSSRDQTDRAEISEMVREGEKILYLFAGAGPYAVAIAKRKHVKWIYAVEINPWGFKYMIDNIKINKLDNIVPIRADVSLFCKNFYEKVNRIIMTLPLGAHKYLDLALACAEDGGFIHFYHTGPEEEPFREAEELLKSVCPYCVVINKRIVRDYAPHVYKVRIDVLLKRRAT
ncbi:class I SAM-dependent methyltransferase [Thermoproteus tenax]|uniref:Wybutosine (YW) biosynthesis enzyme, methyltransferase n=1 Tax=Thermoproteus tenax (strain ATCC 35583 / DSM 2078 / JCM 9277 / NBRC 100435 / Kra 1) TaxID=768679 RepID=G4RL65_THETK|nr:class I SAM-dependent methyltransferase family protein [Thermoproteus tenax]CCC82310.1 Wybutosine (yW) biosynthesis enzyme, methyltransferase [Thermoproteus tenax Kra 1]